MNNCADIANVNDNVSSFSKRYIVILRIDLFSLFSLLTIAALSHFCWRYVVRVNNLERSRDSGVDVFSLRPISRRVPGPDLGMLGPVTQEWNSWIDKLKKRKEKERKEEKRSIISKHEDSPKSGPAKYIAVGVPISLQNSFFLFPIFTSFRIC